jgi:hypothetical protein
MHFNRPTWYVALVFVIFHELLKIESACYNRHGLLQNNSVGVCKLSRKHSVGPNSVSLVVIVLFMYDCQWCGHKGLARPPNANRLDTDLLCTRMRAIATMDLSYQGTSVI